MGSAEGLAGLHDPGVMATAEDDAETSRAEQDVIVGVGCSMDD